MRVGKKRTQTRTRGRHESVGAGAVSVRAGEEDAASGAAKRPSTAASRESASLLHATAKAGDVALSRALGYGGVVEYL